MKKPGRITAILLIFHLVVSAFTISPAFAYRFMKEAAVLNRLGILDGCNPATFDPALGSKVQRQTAVILIVKMFGEKDDALALPQSEIDRILSRFSDSYLIASFARPYMAYAVKTGMVAGTSPTTLGPQVWVDGVSFACMIIKNMGYTVNSRETYLRSLEFLGEISGLDKTTIAILNRDELRRDEAVGIIYAALNAVLPDGRSLIEMLILKGFVNADIAAECGFIDHSAVPGSGELLPVLSDREIVRQAIQKALLSVSTSVIIPINSASDTAEEVFEIWREVVCSDPRILYNSTVTYRADIGLLTFQYSKDVQTVKTHLDLLEKKAESVIKQLIRPGMTDYEKELAIHDYIVNNCTYDLRENKPPESYTAYGALCLGKAVCEGYSQATKLLLDMAGVESIIIIGQAINIDTGRYQNHAWNIVKIQGEYYHLDTTWDDPVMNDGSSYPTYTYFNLPDGDIGRDHKWDKSVYPACVSTDYNYYVYNDMIAMDYDAFVSHVVRKADEDVGSVTVKVSDNGEIGFDLNKAIKDIHSKTDRRIYAYRPVNIYGIMELFFK